ncbi:MAG: lipopolysaccharide biosynthesis protein [Oscillospiraceae bacterium]|nr:lipopolysaccharide biosynthesis protein [Oscillospiraceae bacterium]
MGTQNERNVNITLKNEEADKEEVVISFTSILNMLKRFLAFWLIAAIVVGILVPVASAIFTADQHKNLTALVSFNYDGIEKGLAPDKTQFDVNSIKNPSVIQAALEELDLPLESLESIRKSITIEGVIPDDAIARITMYKSVYEQGNLNAGEKMLDTSYFPTQYRLSFNYSSSGLSGKDAVAVFDTMLKKYREYFFKSYGFNRALGSAVKALDYSTYDYAEAVDVFNNTLTKMQSYVNTLSNEDTTRFRSTQTGYTFADLSDSIGTLKTVDLDMISSYITVNNVTKDKNTLIDYYNFRIETLMRERSVATDNLNSVNNAIETYQQSVTIIYGDGQDPQQYTQGSAEYDDLFKKKIEAQNTVSSKTQSINMYQQRVNALKGKAGASQDKIEKVEKDLAGLNKKINELLDITNITANEYYESVYLGNAYSILVPPSSSALNTTKNVLDSSMEVLLIAEALILVIYIMAAFCTALLQDTKKAHAEKVAGGKEAKSSDEEDDEKDTSEK